MIRLVGTLILFSLVSAKTSGAEQKEILDTKSQNNWLIVDTVAPPAWFDLHGAGGVFRQTSFDDVDTLLQNHGLLDVRMSLGSAWNAKRADVKRQLGFDRSLLVRLEGLPSVESLHSLCDSLNELPNVESARPLTFGRGASITPDDTFFGDQWHHKNTRQEGGIFDADVDTTVAWSIESGSLNTLVAVLDSGLLTDHPEFAGRVVPGFDFVNEDGDPTDDHSHGTRVTGILAAAGNNGFGIAGVDWFCRVLPVKVLNADNTGSVTDLARGLVYAADADADVINMSLEDYSDDPILHAALVYARMAGSILVSCAGNGGQGDADRSFPGASELTITVGTTKPDDQRHARSGTGARLDFMAPGVDITTLAFSLDDETVLMTGCSAATPIVSGIISLMLGMRPGMSQDEVYEILATTSEDEIGPSHLDLPGRDDQYGYGRVDAARALTQAHEGIVVYGSDGGGLEGISPKLTTNLSLRPGEPNFKLFIDEARGATTGFLVMGTEASEITLGSEIVFLVGNPIFFLGLPFSGTPDAPGEGSVQLGPVAVPNNPGLIGVTLYFQALVFDDAHPDGISHSRGLEIEIVP